MINKECEDLFLKIRATTHALDKLIEDDTSSGASEDINVLSLMLVQLVDKFDEERKKDRMAKRAEAHNLRSCLFVSDYSPVTRLCSFPRR